MYSKPLTPAMSAARAALRAEKRRPTDADRPPVRPGPGRKPKLPAGQLDFFGGEHGAADGDTSEDDDRRAA
jgi:hypothetical protein